MFIASSETGRIRTYLPRPIQQFFKRHRFTVCCCYSLIAESEGFDPPQHFCCHRFSRPQHYLTLPTLQRRWSDSNRHKQGCSLSPKPFSHIFAEEPGYDPGQPFGWLFLSRETSYQFDHSSKSAPSRIQTYMAFLPSDPKSDAYFLSAIGANIYQCAQWDLNPHDLKRPLDFKSSTYSIPSQAQKKAFQGGVGRLKTQTSDMKLPSLPALIT